MEIWLIEPHDPLIVRDGKPFGPNSGARAATLPFPFPSTTTGGIRSRAGMNDDGVFELPSEETRRKEKIKNLKKLTVRGPLLVQLSEDGNGIVVNKWLVPAPADALVFETEPLSDKQSRNDKEGLIRQLIPRKTQQFASGAETDLDSEGEDALMLVGLPENEDNLGKPHKKPPLYWYWNIFENWLLEPSRYDRGVEALSRFGHRGPERERRLHVSIDTERRAAKEGALFETSGLEFTHAGDRWQRLSEAERLALAVIVGEDEDTQNTIRGGTTGFAGERRIVSWRKSNSTLPTCDPGLKEAIKTQKACRVFLLTPAYFKEGYRPTWLLELRDGVQPKLEAIAIQRPQVVSGWDFEKRKPKPTRRLAPAGTVLFLTLEGTPEAIETWVDKIWMHCISDDEDNKENSDNPDQYRNDGFGLAVLGIWPSESEEIQEEEGEES